MPDKRFSRGCAAASCRYTCELSKDPHVAGRRLAAIGPTGQTSEGRPGLGAIVAILHSGAESCAVQSRPAGDPVPQDSHAPEKAAGLGPPQTAAPVAPVFV